MSRVRYSARPRRGASVVQPDMFAVPSVPRSLPVSIGRHDEWDAVPPTAAEVERARVGTLLMLFHLSDAPGDIGRSASLWFADALRAWHASRAAPF